MTMKKRIITLIVVLCTFFGVLSVYASAASKPEAPVISAANITSTGKNKIKWVKTAKASYYRVYRSKRKDGGYVHVKSTSDLSYIDNDAQAGQTYYYCVKAVTSNKTASNASKKVKVTCKLARPAVNLSNFENSQKIQVKWKKVSGAQKYEVYRASSKNGRYSLIKTTTETSMTNKSVEPGKRYYYKVRAIAKNKSANSAYSAIKSEACVLAKPELLKPGINLNGDIVLSWASVKGAERYCVYRSENKTKDYTRIATLAGKKFTDTRIKNGQTYYYKVSAVNGDSAANSGRSVVKNIKIVKSNGFIVGVTLGEDGSPSFVWNKIKGASSYEVYRSFYSNKGFSLLSTSARRSYSNPSAPQGLTLYYKFVALDSSKRKTATSKIIEITTTLKEKESLKTCYLKQYMTKVYSLPSSDSIPTRVRYMDKIMLGNAILSRTNGKWYRVFYEGELYYLWSEDVKSLLTDKKSTFKYKGNTIYQQEIIDLAVDIAQNQETSYKHTESPGIPDINDVYSFDCSGFVKYVFNSVMQKYNPVYDVPADVQKLYETVGVCNEGYKGEFNATDVGIDDLQPGDVLFFESLIEDKDRPPGEIKHIAIYLGNNEFVHCTSTWEDSVCIAPLTGRYLEKFAGARRYLPESVTKAGAETTIKGSLEKNNVYEEKSIDSDVIETLAPGDTVTVLFTNSENWAYIETSSGLKGYILLKYLV